MFEVKWGPMQLTPGGLSQAVLPPMQLRQQCHMLGAKQKNILPGKRCNPLMHGYHMCYVLHMLLYYTGYVLCVVYACSCATSSSILYVVYIQSPCHTINNHKIYLL